jgi:hypothetical protein
MSDDTANRDAAAAARAMQDMGLTGFMEQVTQLQDSLGKVADGMSALGESALRQGENSENLAAHIIAIESVLAVMLRHIPLDINDVRAEADRRTKNIDSSSPGGPSVVRQLAEDIVRRSDD